MRTATGDADLIVTLTGADSALPSDLVGGIRAVPGVEKVEEQTAGIAVVDDEEDAKFERVNGWYLAGRIATKPLSEAGFLHRLTESQVRAGITAALRA